MFNSNKFNSRFEKNQRNFDIIFRVVSVFIVVVFITVLAFWVLVGTVAYKAVDQVESQGLKAVIEQVWCGPDKKCL